MVATFHTAITRSRVMAAAHGALQLVSNGSPPGSRSASWPDGCTWSTSGGGAVEIPNGVDVARYASAEPLPGWPGECGPGYGGALGFLGRFDEPRKGFATLREAFCRLAPARPGLRLLVAGPGDVTEALREVPPQLRDRIVFLGRVSEEDKVRMLRSVDLYVAPNTGGESFGMILTEAMAARTPVVATELDAFRRVLDGSGRPVPDRGRRPALAATAAELLDDPAARAAMAQRAAQLVAAYDWPVVAQRILEVYASAIEATGGTVVEGELGEVPSTD